jgi:hypothetical protein
MNSKRGLQDRLIRGAYKEKNKEVKKKIRNDKRHWIHGQAKTAEEAARTGNLKGLSVTTRVLSWKKFAGNKSVKGTDGNLITWNKGILIKLPTKEDLSNCNNWRGIALLPIVSKVFSRIILNRIQGPVVKIIRKEQAGFRANCSRIDHINTLRIIIEHSMEW